MVCVLVAAVLVACDPVVLRPRLDKNGQFCRPLCWRKDLLPGRRECRAEGDRDYCTGEVFHAGAWRPSKEPLP